MSGQVQSNHGDGDDDTSYQPQPKILKFSKLNKTIPNQIETTKNGSIVAAHYNELEELGSEGRKSSQIFHMRNLNNWIKTELINEYYIKVKGRLRYGDSFRVLDLCCGKGGDLFKWQSNRINHLIATDIAEVSIGHCMERYENLKRRHNGRTFTAEFFACDATTNLIRGYFQNPSEKVQLVSCQFAFHYCFESFAQANLMVRNISDCLEENGYFICTIPNANEIMRRLRNCGNRSFGNNCYNITFNCNTEPPPLFGAQYVFKLEDVVDCPEFLVHFPTMVQLCRRYGLVLVRSNTFVEYFEEKQEYSQQLFNRMNCFKEIDSATITADNTEYEHVFKHKRWHGNVKVRTLSKSEWEAFCLYKVCAFRKCKTIIGKDTKPEYIIEDQPELDRGCQPSVSHQSRNSSCRKRPYDNQTR